MQVLFWKEAWKVYFYAHKKVYSWKRCKACQNCVSQAQMLDRSLSPFQFSVRSLMDSLFRLKLVLSRALIVRIELYCILFEITNDPCNLIESRRCDSYTNRTILSSKSHIFPSQWDIFTKTQQPIKFQGLFKEINEIKRKWGTTFYKPAQYTDWINNIFLQTKKNRANKFCDHKTDVIKW